MTERECLTLLRRRLKISYRRAAELVAAAVDGSPMPGSTILRWEEGSRSRVPNFVKILALAYLRSEEFGRLSDEDRQAVEKQIADAAPSEDGDDGKTATIESEPLRFGLTAFPDSALFAAMGEILGDGFKTAVVPETRRLLNLIKENQVDLAICGPEISAAELAGANLNQEVSLRPLTKLRGSALLVGSGQRWIAFNQLYLDNPTKTILRKKRVRDAIGALLRQFQQRGVKPEDFYIPNDSNRMRALIEILLAGVESEMIVGSAGENKDAQKESPLDYVNKLIARLAKPAEDDVTYDKGTNAYNAFAKTLAIEGPQQSNALFAGGLTHRLQLEDQGAAPLIDGDDLQTIATLDSARLSTLLFPTNCLLIHRRALQRDKNLVISLRQRWNEMVVRFRERQKSDLDWASKAVDYQMRLVLTDQGDEHSWRAGTGLFERVVQEQLIEFLYWPNDLETV